MEEHIIEIPHANKFADTLTQNGESHFILDFQVGKDVGLGMFGGRDGSSVLNLGVRYAQFSSKSNIALRTDPDWRFTTIYVYSAFKFIASPYHSNAAGISAARSFHGVGPSLSWNASAPFLGNPQDSELAFDWGVNAAILFGRQRAAVHHHTTAEFQSKYAGGSHKRFHHTLYQHSLPAQTRVRSVTVPNVGGFAGVSFRYSDAKVSFGYRADFFFGAMDGGIDTAKSENRGFYGPFATISIGLGG